MPGGPVYAGPTSPDVKGTEGPKLGRDVSYHVDGLPHERLQVSGRVPEVQGDTPSNNPQLPAVLTLFYVAISVASYGFLALSYLSVAVVSGRCPTRVVLHKTGEG